MTTLEALEARRDDLWFLLCRYGGDCDDWAELERLNDSLRAALLDACPHVAIDHAAIEAWEQSRARDYDVTDDVPY